MLFGRFRRCLWFRHIQRDQQTERVKVLSLGLAEYGGEVLDEGFQEGVEQLADDIITSIAYEMSGMAVPDEVKPSLRKVVSSTLQGAGSAILLGVPGAAINARSSAGQMSTLKKAAEASPSKKAFVKAAMAAEKSGATSFFSETVSDSDKKESFSRFWEKQQAKKESKMSEQEREELRITDVEDIVQPGNIGDRIPVLDDNGQPMKDKNGQVIYEEVEPVASNRNLPEIQRLKDGRLRTQESDIVRQNTDGTETHMLLLGSVGTSQRYGVITYSINPDDNTLTIDNVATAAGFQDITSDAVVELSRRYEGMDIVWDPQAESQQAVKADLIKNNPRGSEYGLSYYDAITDTDAEIALAKEIKQKFPNMNADEAKVAVKIFSLAAEVQGKTLNQWTSDHLAGFEYDADEKGRGRIEFEKDVSRGVKATIYASQKADFSTFAHEAFHLIRRTTGQSKALAQAIANAAKTEDFKNYITNHQQIIGMSAEEALKAAQSFESMEDGMAWSEAQEELAATLFESYLHDNATMSKKLKNLFQKIADWFARVYRAIKHSVKMDEGVVKAFDSLLDANSDLKQSYEKTETTATADNSGEFSREKDSILFQSEIKNTVDEQIDALKEEDVIKSNQNIIVISDQTPVVLRLVGMPNLPISVMAHKVAEGIFSDNYQESGHSDALTKANVKEVLHNLADPFMVFEGSHKNSVAAIYSIVAENGNPMLVSLFANREMPDQTVVNRISSIYGKAVDSIGHWIEDGKLLYLDDTKETPIVLQRLQLPSALQASSNRNIIRKSRIVNSLTQAGEGVSVLYQGYDWSRGMSNNAVAAYEDGEKPMSKWTNAAINEAIDNDSGASPEVAERLKALPKETKQAMLLEYASWHHTGKYYNRTRFFSIKDLSDITLSDIDYYLSAREKYNAAYSEYQAEADKLMSSGDAGLRRSPSGVGRVITDENGETRYERILDAPNYPPGYPHQLSHRVDVETLHQSTVAPALTPEAQRQYDEVVAKYKDTDQWLKAPNGKPTNLTERQWVQVRTPAFKAWFGDWENDPENSSVILDANGDPLVAFHGSLNFFDVFKRGDIGYHFGTEKQAEEALLNHYNNEAPWFGSGEPQEGEIPPLYQVFLNIRHPIYWDEDAGSWTGDNVQLYKALEEKGYLTAFQAKSLDRMYEYDDLYNRNGDASRLTGYLKKYLIQNGYDGVVYTNKFEGVRYEGKEQVYDKSFIAFSPEQIKSATDNSGELSPYSPSILRQNDITPEDNAVAEAKTFSSWEDWHGYATFMLELDENEIARAWDEAHAVPKESFFSEGMSDEDKDRTFSDWIDSDEGLDSFVKHLRSTESVRRDIDNTRFGGVDENSLAEYEVAERVQKEASPFIAAIAKGKHDLTDTARKTVRSMVKNNVRMYRDLYAAVLNDESLQAAVYDEYLPKIQEPSVSSMSIMDRKRLSNKIEAAELKKKILSGEETVEGEVEKVIKQLDLDIADLKKQLAAAEIEEAELRKKLTDKQNDYLTKVREEREAKEQLDRVNRRLRDKLDKGRKLSINEVKYRQSLQGKIALLQEQLAALNAQEIEIRKNIRVKATQEKWEAIRKTKEQIAVKQAERREAKMVHDYKQGLLAGIRAQASDNVDYEYAQQIRAVQALVADVSGYQNKYITYKGERMSLDDFRKAVDEGRIEIEGLTDYQMKRYMTKSLADFTIEELETLLDTISYFKDMGKKMWQAKVDQRAAKAEMLQRQIMASLMANKRYTPPEQIPLPDSGEDKTRRRSLREKGRILKYKAWNMARKAQMLDNDTKGVAYNLLIQRKRDAQSKEYRAIAGRMAPVIELMKQNGIKPEDIYEKVPVVIDGRTYTYTMSDLYYGLMAQKDVRNYFAFAYGSLVTAAEKREILGNNRQRNQQIMQIGNRRNAQFVAQAEAALAQRPQLVEVFEAIDKDMQTQAPRLNEVLIREYNKPLSAQDHYLPIYRTDFNGTDIAARIQDDVFNQNAGKNTTTPERGFTKERIDISPDHQTPVSLDFFGTWQESMNQQEHLIANIEYVRELNRVFKNYGSRDLQSTISATFGDAMLDDIFQYINEVANPEIFSDVQGLNRGINLLRKGLYTGYLGYKPSSVILQAITSPMPYASEVGPLQYIRGMMKMLAHPAETWNFITTLSPFMGNRTMNPVIDEIKKQAEKYTDKKMSRLYQNFLEFGVRGLEWIDKFTVASGWLAVYEKQMAQLSQDENLTTEQAMEQAAKYADNVVYESQPLGDLTELAPLFKTKSEFAKAFTQFQTALNVIWNNVTYDVPKAFKNGQYRKALGFIAGYVIAGTLLKAVQDGFGPDDEPKEKALELLTGAFSQFTDSFPLIGSSISNFADTMITGEKPHEFTKQLFPGIEDVISGAIDLRTGDLDKALKDLARGAGLLVGAPVQGFKELFVETTKKSQETGHVNLEPLLGRRDYKN